MRKCLLFLALFLVIPAGLISCTPREKTPEEMLAEINLDEKSFYKLTSCDQIKMFAEISYQFMDIDHMYVNVPDWMYDSIRNSEEQANASCIKEQILRYITLIEENPNQRDETSLKIHSLIYLSESLDLLANKNITDMLELLVCQKKISNYEHLIVTFFLTRFDELPNSWSGRPEDLEQLWAEACNS